MRRVDLKMLEKIDYHIKNKITGNPVEFAKKVGLSRSGLFLYLSYIRNDLNTCIIYNRYKETYFYQNSQGLEITKKWLYSHQNN